MNKSAKKKNIISMLLTVLVIALYLVPNFASAISIEMKTDKSTYTETDDIITFDVSVDIEDSERVPVKNLTLKINDTYKTCTFSVNGNNLTACSNIKISDVTIHTAGFGYGYQSGYGYGYGTSFENVSTNFGYGYGYGYGYGLTGFSGELRYKVEWNATADNAPNGDYTANLEAYALNNGKKFIYQKKNDITFTISKNSAPVLNAIGDKQVDEGSLLNFSLSATDIDNDNLTFGTNATFGSLNSTSGLFSWTPGFNDAGIYNVLFNVSDGKSGVDSEAIQINVSDTGSSIAGNVSDVVTNVPSLGLEIGGSGDISQNFTGVQNVVFKEGSDNLIEFSWDFSGLEILDLSKIVITTEFANGSQKIIVSGINLTGSATKIVYINQTNESLNSVCVYDNEISSIETMSGDCSFSNETKVECNGVAQSGFTCTDLGTRLKIQGLKHSGLGQISYTAPVSTTPSGDGTTSAVAGGGGSGFYWQCTEWSECTPQGVQTRACSLVTSSGGPLTKPEETRSCTYTTPAPTGEETPTAPTAPTPTTAVTPTAPTAPTGFAALTGRVISGLTKPSGIAAIIVSILVLGGGYGAYYYLYKRKR